MLRAKFSTLKQILNELGFVMKRTPGKSALFKNPETGNWFLYSDYADDEEVLASDLAAARYQLDSRGYLSREEFEELLEERRVAG
ncbi:MAG: hypothetical protein K2W96_00530 [Gemmataceae bacterium]|nr:hypothetical protein [Gemmataceae bacterium]